MRLHHLKNGLFAFNEIEAGYFAIRIRFFSFSRDETSQSHAGIRFWGRTQTSLTATCDLGQRRLGAIRNGLTIPLGMASN